MTLWTVYYNPSDFPGKYVARRWLAAESGAMPTLEYVVSDTLVGVRVLFNMRTPVVLHRRPRQPEDDPCIVEVWF